MGRTKERPRYRVISFRVDDQDRRRILECAESPGQCLGDLVRGLVEDGIKARKAGDSDGGAE